MKKFEITEEQIRKVVEYKENLFKERVESLVKEWFPEAFKTELENMIKPQELRLGNLVNVPREDQSPFRIYGFDFLNEKDCKIEGERKEIGGFPVHPLNWYLADLIPVPITPETIEKYIDWEFEKGFNKSIVEKEYWIETHYLLENIIDGSSDFEIVFCQNKSDKHLDDIYYYVDDNILEFALDDNFHNLQNLFYIASGQELPIKI